MNKKVISFVLILVIVTMTFASVVYASSNRLLRLGSRGSDVRTLQQRLNSSGYNCGSVDGIFGNRTLNAVRNFQRKNGLAVDGIVGPATRGKLFGSSTPPKGGTGSGSSGGSSSSKAPITGLLRRGSRGSQVSTLQSRLNQLGYNSGSVDGIFGNLTYNAVVRFQRAQKLVVDGIVGPATIAKLYPSGSSSGGSGSKPPAQPAGTTAILSKTRSSVKQMEDWARGQGATNEFISLARLYMNIAPKEGVNPEGAYAQAAHETGYGKFGGVINASYKNPCGIKTSTGGGDSDPNAHQKFSSWEKGIQAHVEHLALYAGAKGYPKGKPTDPRHFEQLFGRAKTFKALGGQWAPSAAYGNNIERLIQDILNK
ncbi:MAG: hypothetical protein GX329_05315 [Tissierellia bacterium]|nr:hypothetical protein [Tissierellia bacterium]